MTTWEPSASDITWQRNVIDGLFGKKGTGVWSMHGELSHTIDVEVNKRLKTYRLVKGSTDDEMYQRVAKVFNKIGYKQGTKPDPESN